MGAVPQAEHAGQGVMAMGGDRAEMRGWRLRGLVRKGRGEAQPGRCEHGCTSKCAVQPQLYKDLNHRKQPSCWPLYG